MSVRVTVNGRQSADTTVDDYTHVTPTPMRPMTVNGRVQRVVPPITQENIVTHDLTPVAGARVEALIEGIVCGSGLTDTDGRFQLTVAVEPPVPGCARPGVFINFRVNGILCAMPSVDGPLCPAPLPFRSEGSAAVDLRLPAGTLPPPIGWP